MQRQNNPLLASLAAPRLGGPETFRPERAFQIRLCRVPMKICRRISADTSPQSEIRNPQSEYRNGHKLSYLTKDSNNYFFTGKAGFLVSAIHFVKSSGETESTLSAQGFHFSDFFR